MGIKVPRLNWIAYGFCGAAVALVVQLVLLPPNGGGAAVLLPYLASPFLMLLFGPYLLVPREVWSGSGDWWWWLKILPLYLAHLAFLWGLLSRMGGFVKTPRGRKLRLYAIWLVACLSALFILSAIPVVERHVLLIRNGPVRPPVRLAVIGDLHSCRYGRGQRGLVEMVESRRPDVVLMVGDIFDDRLPDGPTQEFVTEIVKRHPCVYVTGNHEFWSGRVADMRAWMAQAGVTVLQAGCKTITVKGTPIDFCGVDDPTEMRESEWIGLLKEAYGQSDPEHVRVLLTHRPEYPDVYAQFDYNLVLAGHAHGGQWHCPFFDFSAYAPNQHFFPKYVNGSYRLSNGARMIVGRGLARESTPFPRLFNPPEVVFIDMLWLGTDGE